MSYRSFPQLDLILLKLVPALYRANGQVSEVAQAMGTFSEKIADPGEIVPAIKRGLEVTASGRAVGLEFITKGEGGYSKVQFR